MPTLDDLAASALPANGKGLGTLSHLTCAVLVQNELWDSSLEAGWAGRAKRAQNDAKSNYRRSQQQSRRRDVDTLARCGGSGGNGGTKPGGGKGKPIPSEPEPKPKPPTTKPQTDKDAPGLS